MKIVETLPNSQFVISMKEEDFNLIKFDVEKYFTRCPEEIFIQNGIVSFFCDQIPKNFPIDCYTWNLVGKLWALISIKDQSNRNIRFDGGMSMQYEKSCDNTPPITVVSNPISPHHSKINLT